MGKIKSAIELAMEKTADLKVDRVVVKKNSLIREGKVSASSYLDSPKRSDIKDKLNHYKGEEQEWFCTGAVETILANLTLPQIEADLEKMNVLSEVLIILKKDKKQVNGMFDQLKQLFQQFLSNMDQLEEGLKKQYEPQLRQKEMQIKQERGQDIHLTADSDPEFIKLLSEQYSRMEQQYNEVLKQAKDEMKKF